jgi:nucleotide-binding universal stress UspA family protein
VLVASFLDDSGARAAVRAARLPLAPGARVVMLHVVQPWTTRAGTRRSPGEARRALERLAAVAADAAAAAGNAGPQFAPLVWEGWPATEIVRAAWQERSELVVVGPPTTRIDGTARGTIFRVLRRADLPLLVARSDGWRDHAAVLCAVDRSVTAVDTIALAARIASGTARELALFHGYHVPFERWIGEDAPELEREAASYLRALAWAVAEDAPITRTVVRRADPAAGILAAAREQRADLVVLGTRGRSGLARALVGSTAEWVIAHLPCDVAVARPHRVTLEPR